MMAFKASLLFLTLLVASNAVPVKKQDMSIYFDHTNTEARIIGGVNAGPVPYMAALTTGVLTRSLMCGASVITPTSLLTAAHCIDAVRTIPGSLMVSLRAIVGTDRWNTGGTQYALRDFAQHPKYDLIDVKNDIGILYTVLKIAFTKSVHPIALNYDFVDADVPTSVAGWGRTRPGGSVSQILLRLDARVIDGQRCAGEVARRGEELNLIIPLVDPDLEICTFHSNGHGVCNGDSGSPLIRTDSDEEQQIGIVSWSVLCAVNAPDMFVRVSAYKTWLLENLL